MAQIEYIRHLYEVEGKSLREIAKTLQMNFRTVQKYAYRDDWNPPVKLSTSPEDYPVLGTYIPVIDGWLEQDERELRKQRHTITRIYSRLQNEQGYKGSYSSVKKYVNRGKDELRKYKESFLPLAHPPGHAQVILYHKS